MLSAFNTFNFKQQIREIRADKYFLKTMLAIALPISFQALIQSFLGMIDQMMVGQYGETAIAGVGLGGTISFILMIALGGIVAGGGIFLAQQWGNKNTHDMKKVMATMLRLGILISLGITMIAVSFPERAIGIFTKDVEVIATGGRFLRIIALSYLPMFLILCFSALLRNSGQVKIPLYTGVTAVLLNTALNYIMIFGKLGFPALGIEGAAIATLLTRVIEAMMLILACRHYKLPGLPSMKQLFVIDWEFSKIFLLTCYPVVLNEIIWVLGDSMYSVIYGHMGTAEMAAMTMTFPVQGMFIGFFTGLSSAAGMMIGNVLGAGENDKALDYAKKFVVMTVLGSAMVGVLIVALSNVYLSAYQVGEEVRTLCFQLLLVFAAMLWLKVTNMVLGNGILRSGGETKFTFYIDMLGLWGIGVPLGFLAAFVFKLSVTGVYVMIAVEEFVRLALCLKRMNSKKWINNLVHTPVFEESFTNS